ncbi:hypothetical protein FALBO_14084 [Fusarium albosuccineum]|uniref:Uncharacterized protein n=1 Tax=Fusarium albosuccineum TaxID=1237068 RepID=A0A8H4P1K0_9HYPO|nr:hypothetical protein FALBO_14084 [Fusarium albosuccineum]
MSISRAIASWLPQSVSNRRYHAVPTDSNPDFSLHDKSTPGCQVVPRRWLRLSTKGVLLVICAILALPGFLLVVASKGYRYFSGDPAAVPQPEAGERRFIVVLPANAPNTDLCKITSTAVALGYPAPIIVNWGRDYNGKGWHGGSHLDKIVGNFDFLHWISSESANEAERLGDNDVMVLVDSYDTWFQLPPNVLLQRYHEANRQANERLAQQWHGPGEMPMQQTIIVSTQKRCFPPPSSGSILHCDSLPESPLRKDLYGPTTDDDPEVFHNNRPRYLNSGSIIGQIGDLRRYFGRVKERMKKGQAKGTHLYSDQGIFAEIFAEQEIWRQHLRDQPLIDDEAMKMFQEQYEYHVGLDYSQQLFIPTVFEEQDGDIITLNNKTEILERSTALGISPVRLDGVPDDLNNTTNPLQKTGAANLDWGELPLYSDFFTTAIPAVIHHNAHKDGLKARRTKWWDRTWYFPHLRELITAHLEPGENEPLSTISVQKGNIVYRAPETFKDRKNPRLFKGDKGLEEANFKAICESPKQSEGGETMWYDEVFRDGKGPL